MTGGVGRLGSIAALAAMLTAQVLAAAPATVAAPVSEGPGPADIDMRLLPAATPPHPAATTTQTAVCATGEVTRRADLSAVGARALPGDLDALWRLSRGAGQTVAIIDTGVAPHARLRQVRGGGDYVGDGDGTQDCDGHGTLVAGLVAARPRFGDGFSGVAPDAALLSVRQSSERFGVAGRAPGVGDVATMAAAVRTAADLGADVINISSVACTAADAGVDDRALGAAVAHAVDVRDAVVVAAAGNAGSTPQCPQQGGDGRSGWRGVTVAASPAWYDDLVLAVGSAAPDGTPSAFSLAGPWVDVLAPGEDVVSLGTDGMHLVDAAHDVSGRRSALAGTSFAAPLVSGLAALVRARFPALSAREVMARIERTAVPAPGGPDARGGLGMVDAAAALSDTSAAPSDVAPASRRVAAPQVPPTGSRPATVALSGAGACGVLVIVVLGGSALRTLSPALRASPRGGRPR